MRNFLYKTETRRIVMRFVEIFVLSGVIGLVNSREFEQSIIAALGTALAAAILKYIREITAPTATK